MSPFDAFRKPVSVTRPSAGSYVDGVWQDGATTALTIRASVQPATAEDLQSLPENRRSLGAYRLYSSEPFQALIENVQNPDIVTIDGQQYEIARVDPWKNGLIEHFKSLAVRVQPNE